MRLHSSFVTISWLAWREKLAKRVSHHYHTKATFGRKHIDSKEHTEIEEVHILHGGTGSVSVWEQ